MRQATHDGCTGQAQYGEHSSHRQADDFVN
jgi:hypothetical protein